MLPALGRLNADATWWVQWAGHRVLFDPWLVGSEVDGVRWFHEAWHTGPVLEPSAARADVVVVSQGFADHCHPETLRRLPDSPHFLAVRGARDAVAAARPDDAVDDIPAWGEPPARVGDLRVWRITPPWTQPPGYHAIVLADRDGRAVIHAPHGLDPERGRDVAAELQVVLLAVSRVEYRLPWILGGRANPGNDQAVAAARACHAAHVLAIHDEDKRSRGLAARLATVDRGPWPSDGLNWVEADYRS